MGDNSIDLLDQRLEGVVQSRRLAVLSALDDHGGDATLDTLHAHLEHSDTRPDLTPETMLITLLSLDSIVSFEPERPDPADFDPEEVEVVAKDTSKSEIESILYLDDEE